MASFQYDAMGRWQAKTVAGAATRFLYDGLNPVQELSGASVTASLLTGCEVGALSAAFGTAKMRTTDSRARWVHGGGSRFGQNAWDPRQGWAPTDGCTRAQNEDVESLCKAIATWR